MREFQAAILDWDNTLHDSARINFAALRKVLRQYGIEITEADYRRAYTPDYRRLYERLGLPSTEIEAASDRWRALVSRAVPRMLPGADEGLDRLASAGIRLALLTTGPRPIVEPQLERLGLASRFAALMFGDGQALRPDPAPLRELVGRLGVEASAAILCSDSPADMRMARAAGVRAVGLTTFVADDTTLTKAGAHETAPTLLDWVERTLSPASGAGRGAPP